MKKAVLRKSAVLIFFASLISPLAFRFNLNASQVKAEDPWSEELSAVNLVIKYGKAVVDDATADYKTAESGRYSYFVRHGYLTNNKCYKYDTVTSNGTTSASFTSNTATDSSALHWKWTINGGKTSSNTEDGVIVGITAKEHLFYSIDPMTFKGWPNSGKANTYVQRSGETTYELIQSVILVNTSTSYSQSQVDLDVGDTVYFEYIQLSGSGNLQSSGGSGLPVFKLREFVVLPPSRLEPTQYISAITTNPTSETENGLATYTIKNSSITDAGYGSSAAGNLGAADTNYHFTNSNLILKDGQKATLQINALQSIYIQLDLVSGVKTTCEGLTLNGYLFSASSNKTKLIYSTTYGDKFDVRIPKGNVLLGTNDILYIEYSSLAGSNIDIDLLPIFTVNQAVGDVPANDFPKYNPRDYSTLASIDYLTVLKESARLRCEPISTKDFDISLLTGVIGKGNDDIKKFDYINYTDGQYIDAPAEAESASMYQGSDTFNAAYGAACESYRVAFSDANYVIFAMAANKNTHVTVSHEEITGGWVNGYAIYVYGFQDLGGIVVKTESINVPKQTLSTDPIPANTLSIEFDLQEGDIGYYVFGSPTAHNTNLNITPTFTSDPSLYDENERNSHGECSMMYHDLVSGTVKSDGKALDYGVLTAFLGHGSPDDIQRMDLFTGTGESDAKDSASTTGTNAPKFWRWQMQCGKNDDALISFKANMNINLTIVWRKEAEITDWATHTALKTYAVDTDNFLMLDQVKLCTNEGHGAIDDTYYNYDVHLKKDQTFIICYTSMGANYGVIQYDFSIKAVAKDFDLTKTFDFTAAKTLYEHYLVKTDELKAIVDSLNPSDYSLVNWAYIDEALTKFINEAREADSAEKIDQLFEECKSKIYSIPNLTQEAAMLAKAKEDAKKEVRDYLDSKKSFMSKDNWAKAEELYNAFAVKVDKQTSTSKVNIEVIRIKAQIDQLCDVDPALTALIIGLSVGGGVLVLGGAALAVVLIVRHKKAKNKEQVEEKKEE